MSEKKILDITCGSRSIWFNKNHPAAIYCDKRQEEHYNVWKNDNGKAERACVISPDVVCDFTSLPFEDNSFSLVVFDPPHLTSAKETAWLVKKYSKLERPAYSEDQKQDLPRHRQSHGRTMGRTSMSEHILSLSYGKDSLACLGAIEALGWPLDRIIHAEVWATDTIPADLPPMVEFKAKADKWIKERYGIEVEHIKTKPYQHYFYQQRTSDRKDHPNSIWGFPFQQGAWCNSRCKVRPLNSATKDGIVYVGIAADEPNRFHNLTETKRSPLVEAGWTEDMCRKWCEMRDLLSPIYTTATRGGCWFCHNQGVDQLRLLRRDYPEYWALLMKWDLDSPVTFKPDGHTVHDFDRRFALEDEGIVNPIHPFRWAMLDGDVQLRF